MKVIINSCLISNRVEDFQVLLAPESRVLVTAQNMEDAYGLIKELEKFNIPYKVMGRLLEIKCNSISAYRH